MNLEMLIDFSLIKFANFERVLTDKILNVDRLLTDKLLNAEVFDIKH